MDESAAFATKAELEQLKKEQKRMAIQLEVDSRALDALTQDVALLSERAERIEAKVDALDAKVDALDAKVDRGFAALTSVVLSMGRK
jgi:hypothetical protein